MHTNYFAYENESLAAAANKEASANFVSLNGLWKFNWVKDADRRPTDFFNTSFNDKGWVDMPVPGVWELNGFGHPIYVNVGYPWRNQFQSNPPAFPTENNNVGSYRREIVVPANWKGKDIIAHFGSVTSNIYLWVIPGVISLIATRLHFLPKTTTWVRTAAKLWFLPTGKEKILLRISAQ